MSTPTKKIDQNATSSSITKTDVQDAENIQFHDPPKEIATRNPNHPNEKESNKVENQQKSEGILYVNYI